MTMPVYSTPFTVLLQHSLAVSENSLCSVGTMLLGTVFPVGTKSKSAAIAFAAVRDPRGATRAITVTRLGCSICRRICTWLGKLGSAAELKDLDVTR